MCGSGKHNLVFLVLDVALSEEILQDRNLRQSGEPGQRFYFLVFENSSQNVYFAFFETNLVLNFSLANHGLADSANVLLPVTDEICIEIFSVTSRPGINLGRDIDIYADIEILELCVHQRIDADAADSRLE